MSGTTTSKNNNFRWQCMYESKDIHTSQRKPKGTIKEGQSRDTGKIGHIRHKRKHNTADQRDEQDRSHKTTGDEPSRYAGSAS